MSDILIPPEANQLHGIGVIDKRLACNFFGKGGGSWKAKISNPCIYFEPMSKRRKGFPSETKVKKGLRVVHGDKELTEKLGRDDLCPCDSGKRFKKCCLKTGCF